MPVAYLEPIGGLSGDIFLGALMDAGMPPAVLERTVVQLGLEGITVTSERVRKAGIAATKVSVRSSHDEHGHGRRAAELVRIVAESGLVEDMKSRSIGIIQRLAQAEAKVHGTSVDEVHFHELGGLDTVVDICGVVAGLSALGIERLYCGPLPLGHGLVEAAHGQLPLPAPATAELLVGAPTYGVPIRGETVTPTGAALAVTLAEEFRRPEMVIERIGYGAGTYDFGSVPNVARLSVGEAYPGAEPGEVMVIETNVDDMNPELVPHAMEAALRAGALDAWVTPVIMKKGRPALQLSALAPPERVDPVVQALLQETTTLGLRVSRWSRHCLRRELVQVTTPWGQVTVKVGYLGEDPVTVSPEHDDCARLAAQAGVPVKKVYEAARAAYSSRDASP